MKERDGLIKDIFCILYTYIKMKIAHNKCAWLKVGDKITCGKSCVYIYCKLHAYRLRNGSILPTKCWGCGKGRQSTISHCRGCGGEKIRFRLAKKEKQARDQFNLVMQELLALKIS